MKRHVCLAAILALIVYASPGFAQGRGQGAGGGGNNDNAGMPWEALRAGMLVKWDDALLTSHPYLAPVPIPLTAREVFLGVAPAAVKKQTSHPAAAGAEYINAYFDTILTAVRDRLAREKASSASRPTQ